jgi:hypothetical protein
MSAPFSSLFPRVGLFPVLSGQPGLDGIKQGGPRSVNRETVWAVSPSSASTSDISLPPTASASYPKVHSSASSELDGGVVWLRPRARVDVQYNEFMQGEPRRLSRKLDYVSTASSAEAVWRL